MFDFNELQKNREESIKLINKIITDEINYINKLCLVYSFLKEGHPSVFEENLRSLLRELNELKEMKNDFNSSIKGNIGCDLTDKVKSLSELKILSEKIISEDLDKTIDQIVEESEVNTICMEDSIDCLSEIDDQAFDLFISKIRDINEETINYIVRSIGYINQNNKGGR